MFTPYLLIISFGFFGLSVALSLWERKEIRSDVDEKEKLYWTEQQEKYGEGASLRSPPRSILTPRGQLYGLAKFFCLALGILGFLILIVRANN